MYRQENVGLEGPFVPVGSHHKHVDLLIGKVFRYVGHDEGHEVLLGKPARLPALGARLPTGPAVMPGLENDLILLGGIAGPEVRHREGRFDLVP